MKEHPIAGGALQQFQVCVEEQETDNNTTVVFQGVELKGGSAAGRFGSNVSLNQAIEKSTDVTVKELMLDVIIFWVQIRINRQSRQ